jgi:hypothetical protein
MPKSENESVYIDYVKMRIVNEILAGENAANHCVFSIAMF